MSEIGRDKAQTSLKAHHLWAVIDQIAREHGLTVSGLARKAGLDPTTFNRSKRRLRAHDRWPASSSIAKVLEVTGENFLQFAMRVRAVQQARQEPEVAEDERQTDRVRGMRKSDRAGRAALGGA